MENVAKRHKYSYIAFSGGPRGCIGECARTAKNLVKLFGDFRSFTREILLKVFNRRRLALVAPKPVGCNCVVTYNNNTPEHVLDTTTSGVRFRF